VVSAALPVPLMDNLKIIVLWYYVQFCYI
jgi:hypothetical protein